VIVIVVVNAVIAAVLATQVLACYSFAAAAAKVAYPSPLP
jgi:hypothetical protein